MNLFSIELTICPICDSNMKTEYYDDDLPDIECDNKCYVFSATDGYSSVFIFEEEFVTQDDTFFVLKTKEEVEQNIESAIDKIKYWKENNRYLMKIITKE